MSIERIFVHAVEDGDRPSSSIATESAPTGGERNGCSVRRVLSPRDETRGIGCTHDTRKKIDSHEVSHMERQGFFRRLLETSTQDDDIFRGCRDCKLSSDPSPDKLSISDEKMLRKAQKLLEQLGEDSGGCKQALLKHSR